MWMQVLSSKKKNYITSRRIFEQNYLDLNTEAQTFSKEICGDLQ